jgi:outer membrane protein assembly factor BamB
MRTTKRTWCAALGCLLLGACGLAAQDWPQWRGPNRDNKLTGFAAPKAWPKALTARWKVTVGFGSASPALVGDRLYVFTRQQGEEVITCLNVATGETVWQDKYVAVAMRQPAYSMGGTAGGPRSSPAVAGGKVCTFGIGGVLSCLDAATGRVAWRKDTKAWPRWYTRTSPLMVDGLCLVYVGGDQGALTAYDLASGEPRWAWAGDGAPYGSPVLMTAGGVRQIVTPTAKAVAGVALADGKLLWRFPSVGAKVWGNVATPIIDGGTVIYPGQQSGTVAFQVEGRGGEFVTKELWRKKLSDHPFSSPVLKDGLLFGLSANQRFFCTDVGTGEVLWEDGARRGECGTVLDAGPVLLALTSDTYLVAFLPSGKGYTEVARYKVADTPTWAAPIIAGNRVFVKAHDTLALWTLE